MKNDIKAFSPENLGWLEYKLNDQERDYVWRCIKNKKIDYRSKLAGHISSSYTLLDTGDWFFHNTIKPLLESYTVKFVNIAKEFPTRKAHPLWMSEWWVNYQKQGEFNPIHNHAGVYSFVIWMKIPFEWKDQNNNTSLSGNSNGQLVSSFQISYTDIIGGPRAHNYELSKKDEGMMLLFPSKLRHQVYPFYNCDEDRISVSGNITLDTAKSV